MRSWLSGWQSLLIRSANIAWRSTRSNQRKRVESEFHPNNRRIYSCRTLCEEAILFQEPSDFVLANGRAQHVVRPVHENPDGSRFHDHKGFNWMLLSRMLTKDFEIERVVGSPLTWLTPHLASQVWFLARRKA